MTKVTLARDGYIDLTNAMIEYYDDWNHKYISEKDIIAQQQAQQQQMQATEEPTKVEGEVVE